MTQDTNKEGEMAEDAIALTEKLIENAIKSACGYDDIMKAGLTESLVIRTFLDNGKIGFEVVSRERYVRPDDRPPPPPPKEEQ